MKAVEIYLSDLKEETRKEIEDIIGTNHNYDVLPLTVLEFEEDEEDE